MDLLGLGQRSAWVGVAVFLVCSVATWLLSTHLARWVEIISDRTKLGDAVLGTVLLGAIVSLPEMAMALAACVMGNARLAVNTLLGGIMFATLILAFADAVDRTAPLTSDVRRAVVPLEGALCVLMLLMVACGITTGDVPVLGVGAWTLGIGVLYGLVILLIRHTQASADWQVPDSRQMPASSGPEPGASALSTRRVLVYMALAGLSILAAGCVAAQAADTLAQASGLGSSFVGLVLGGVATTLPEVSSTRAAVRLRRYEMAFSDAFGTNMFSVAILLLCDVFYAGKPVLNEVDDFSLVATLLGAAVTIVYVAGLIGRPRKVVLRMGLDSVLVLLMSLAGLVLLYQLRK